MEKSLIQQRIYELSKKDYLDSQSNKLLFEQYTIDKQNNIPPEKSEARTLLIMGNERLVYISMMKHFGIPNPQPDMDQFGAGLIGLIKAIDSFDINRGIAFSTYAMHVITNQIGMEYRQINKRYMTEVNCIWLDEYMSCADDDHNNLKFEDMLGENDAFMEELLEGDDIKKIYDSFKYLDEIEKTCITHVFGLFGNKRISQAKVSNLVGLNQSSVSKIIKNAISKIKVVVQNETLLTDKELKLKQKLLKEEGPLKIVRRKAILENAKDEDFKTMILP